MIEQIDNLWERSENLFYRDRGLIRKGGSTRLIEISSRQKGVSLGFIKWFGQWRQYTFFPKNETIFDKSCLREIADYCEFKTKQHRELNPIERKTWQEKRRLDKKNGLLVI